MEMPVIILFGTPYERGLAHGRRFQDEIARILVRDFASRSPDALPVVRQRAVEAFEAIRAASSDTAEELRGIADGSGQPLSDVVLRSGFELFKLDSESGCSAIAVKTKDGAIVAQNWDAPTEKATELALFLHFSRDRFEFAVVASVGALGWVGMNRRGLALVNNDLILNGYRTGIPSQVVRRIVLAQQNAHLGADALARIPHMGGRAYLIGDCTGHVVAAEVSAKTGAHFLPAATVQLHTNNALHPTTRNEEDQRELVKTYPSSADRLAVLRDVVAGEEEISVEAVQKVLRNETGAPDAICKTTSTDEPTETAFSIIMDCSRGEMHLAHGRPSANAYRKIILPLEPDSGL